jgi:hypothetical protein
MLSPGFWLHHAALAWRAELDARLRLLGLTQAARDAGALLFGDTATDLRTTLRQGAGHRSRWRDRAADGAPVPGG